MLNPLNIISKFIKSSNQKELDRIQKTVEDINLKESKVSKFEDILDRTDITNANIRDLTLDEGETFQYDGKTYKAGDIIIIKETVNVQSAG